MDLSCYLGALFAFIASLNAGHAYSAERLQPGVDAVSPADSSRDRLLEAASSVFGGMRTARSVSDSSSRITGSYLSCYLLTERNEWLTLTKNKRILHLCDIPEWSVEMKIECHQRHVKRPVWRQVVKNYARATRKISYTKRQLVKRLERETPGRPNYVHRLSNRFHWINWNTTIANIRPSANTTHVRCEWRFDLRIQDRRPKYASLNMLEKVWAARVREAESGAHDGCRREDGRLTIMANNNASGRALLERSRYCGRRNLPSQKVKKFYSDAETVKLSYRSHIHNSNVGPFGFFFSYSGNTLPGCPRRDCRKLSIRKEDYVHCRSSSLPKFLRISVRRSTQRVYSLSEVLEGLVIAAQLRTDASPDFSCIERYPLFGDLFRDAEGSQSPSQPKELDPITS